MQFHKATGDPFIPQVHRVRCTPLPNMVTQYCKPCDILEGLWPAKGTAYPVHVQKEGNHPMVTGTWIRLLIAVVDSETFLGPPRLNPPLLSCVWWCQSHREVKFEATLPLPRAVSSVHVSPCQKLSFQQHAGSGGKTCEICELIPSLLSPKNCTVKLGTVPKDHVLKPNATPACREEDLWPLTTGGFFICLLLFFLFFIYFFFFFFTWNMKQGNPCTLHTFEIGCSRLLHCLAGVGEEESTFQVKYNTFYTRNFRCQICLQEPTHHTLPRRSQTLSSTVIPLAEIPKYQWPLEGRRDQNFRLSVCLWISVCPSVRLSLFSLSLLSLSSLSLSFSLLSVCLQTCICLSVCLSVFQSVLPFASLTVHPSVCLCVSGTHPPLTTVLPLPIITRFNSSKHFHHCFFFVIWNFFLSKSF